MELVWATGVPPTQLNPASIKKDCTATRHLPSSRASCRGCSWGGFDFRLTACGRRGILSPVDLVCGGRYGHCQYA
ncbi:MAG: hypothetical protein HW403_583 [Dehalococcoidia bacterium]|nr:hypothetical protein [Dehalococcoidia bacterium]